MEAIKIQQGNDIKLRLKPVYTDGTLISATLLTDIAVSFGTNGHYGSAVAHEVSGDYVVVDITDSMALGVYDVRLTAKFKSRDVQDSRKGLLQIVKYGDGINYKTYTADFVVVGMSDDQVDAAVAAANQAKADADEKKAEYSQKIEALDNVATEAKATANKNEILAAIEAQYAATDAELKEYFGLND